MITPTQFDQLLVPITDLFESFIQTVLEDIARRIIKTGVFTATAQWQMNRLMESGLVYQDALDRLAILTGKSQIILEHMFHQAGIISMAFDNSIYLAAGLKPLPIPLSPAMQWVLLEGVKKTMGQVVNLCLTSAIDAQHLFTNAIDQAYMQVVHGTMSYTQAIKGAIKDIAKEGLHVIDYKNSKDQIDVAVRRAVLSGVAGTVGQIQMDGVLQSGLDLVETSAHIGSRPSHALWQGRVFSLTGKTPGFPSFSETGFGTGPGLMGWNCRHTFYPFYPGTEAIYTEATLDEFEDRKVMYQGKEISVYDASQKQRQMERGIRNYKREAGMLGAAGLDNTEEMDKIHSLQGRLRDFVRETGLIRQPAREGGKI